MKKIKTSLKDSSIELSNEMLETLGITKDSDVNIELNTETNQVIISKISAYEELVKDNEQARKETAPFRWDSTGAELL